MSDETPPNETQVIPAVKQEESPFRGKGAWTIVVFIGLIVVALVLCVIFYLSVFGNADDGGAGAGDGGAQSGRTEQTGQTGPADTSSPLTTPMAPPSPPTHEEPVPELAP